MDIRREIFRVNMVRGGYQENIFTVNMVKGRYQERDLSVPVKQ